MPGGDLLHAAMDELYGGDPDQFITRRTALAAGARTAGDRSVSQQIAALKKPSRSAGILNHLVRTDPGVAERLEDLAIRLRHAEQALDGGQMRALTGERHRLVDDLARQALHAADETSPSATILGEVQATLSAALADPGVAGTLAAGTLVRAASWSGFGIGSPELALVTAPSPTAGRPDEAPNKHAQDTKTDRKRAGEDRRRQERRAAADQARATLDEASRAVADAAGDHDRLQNAVEDLTGQLTSAREDLAAASSALREARARRVAAQEEVRRLEG